MGYYLNFGFAELKLFAILPNCPIFRVISRRMASRYSIFHIQCYYKEDALEKQLLLFIVSATREEYKYEIFNLTSAGKTNVCINK